MLKSDFELGWFNIKKEDYVGYSSGYHHKKHCAVGTTNGAGPHNVQLFVLSPDRVVLHALPGFWAPDDLARELRFAKTLHRLWNDEGRSVAQKKDMCRRMQMAEPHYHSAATFARSNWQPFDIRTERSKGDGRDTALQLLAPEMSKNLASLLSKNTTMSLRPGQSLMKPLNVLVHERMAAMPFVPFAEFDIAGFVDYGQMHYDLNSKHKPGKAFAGQVKIRKMRQLEIAKAKKRARGRS